MTCLRRFEDMDGQGDRIDRMKLMRVTEDFWDIPALSSCKAEVSFTSESHCPNSSPILSSDFSDHDPSLLWNLKQKRSFICAASSCLHGLKCVLLKVSHSSWGLWIPGNWQLSGFSFSLFFWRGGGGYHIFFGIWHLRLPLAQMSVWLQLRN